MLLQYRVGISDPDGMSLGWNEGGEITITAKSATAALQAAHEWADEGDYPGSCVIMLTAVSVDDPLERASERREVR